VFFGWKPEVPDHRDLPYSMMRLALEQPLALPSQVDLRSGCPPIYDQGQLGSCTGNAIAGAFQFDRRKQNLPDFVPSRLFIYYNERAMEGSVSEDAGAYIRDGIKSIAKQGVCKESQWPYNISKFATKPSKSCYTSAVKYRAVSYFRLNNSNLSELKTCLAAGFPFVFGFTVYSSFFQGDTNHGIVPMPGNESVEGGHAVLAVGYDDSNQRFIIRNSWGAGKGDNGYYYMPYPYLTNLSLSDDFWTVRTVTTAALRPIV
jgi:C1A family cysteine protease